MHTCIKTERHSDTLVYRIAGSAFYSSSSCQGSKDKAKAEKIMYISNVISQSYPFCRLQLVDGTFVHPT